MLLHIDGSKHRWLNDDRWHDLIVILDAAASEVCYAQPVEEEWTRNDRKQGSVLCSLQRSGQPLFRHDERGRQGGSTPSDTGRTGNEGVGSADDPGLYAPGAWPFGAQLRNLAGRLPQELRLAGITTVDEANTFRRERYIGAFNQQLSVAADQKGTAFRRTGRSDLNWIFTVQTERVVAKDNTVAIAERSWQIDKTRFRRTLASCTVTIHEHPDETISIRYAPHVIGQFEANGEHRGKGQGPPRPRSSHFPTATTATALSPKPKRQAARAA